MVMKNKLKTEIGTSLEEPKTVKKFIKKNRTAIKAVTTANMMINKINFVKAPFLSALKEKFSLSFNCIMTKVFKPA